MNTHELDDLRAQALRAVDQGLLGTARTRFEQIMAMIEGNDVGMLMAAYDLGAFHWGDTGDGLAAKAMFELVLKKWSKVRETSEVTVRKVCQKQAAYATENLLILATSSSEFEARTEDLRVLAPGEPILSELVPHVKERHDRGDSWAAIMSGIGLSYIKVGHFGGAVHPASGACVFHLLLDNRKELRLSGVLWQAAVLGYTAAITEVLDKAERGIRAVGGSLKDEMSDVASFLPPFVKEYCEHNPGDVKMAKQLERLEAAAAELSSDPGCQKDTTGHSVGAVTAPVPRPGIGHYLSCVIMMALGAWPLFSSAAWGWKVFGGVLLAMGGGGLLGLILMAAGKQAVINCISWRRNGVVEKEVRKQGLAGLAFQVDNYAVDEGDYLYLNFRSVNAVPQDKARFAHMALRSIVALTLPGVVGRMDSHSLADPGASYVIGFGAGIEVPYYELRGPAGSLATLQVGSEVDGEIYQVCIHPSMIGMHSSAMPGVGQTLQGNLGGAFIAQLGKSELRL